MNKQKNHSIVGWGKNRQKVDFYITPKETTESLLHRENFQGTIWECACGDGSMSKVLESRYTKNQVISTDIRTDDKVYGATGTDFFKETRVVDNIITNPPYRYGKEFVEHALKYAKHKVAMLLKLSFLEGSGRYEMFKSTPLKKVYVFCKRQKVYHADKEPNGSGLIAYAWFVWDKSYDGKPTIEWIKD